MTKSEICLQDSAFIGPGLLFLDQYFNSFIDEYIVLWIALVSVLDHTLSNGLGIVLVILLCHFCCHCRGSARVPWRYGS